MIEMRRAPVIIHSLALPGRRLLREVVQQPRLGRRRRAHHMLQVRLRVAGDVGLGEAVAGAGDEHGDVDDEAAEARQRRAEAGQDGLGGPDVGGEVLGEGVGGEIRGGTGALKGGVEVEGAVGVVGALEGVDLAVFERLLAE